MENPGESFKDVMYQGIASFLKLIAKAGESIHGASNEAIHKLDTYQLEKHLDTLYKDLGKQSFDMISLGKDLSEMNQVLMDLVNEIVDVLAEISRRTDSSKDS